MEGYTERTELSSVKLLLVVLVSFACVVNAKQLTVFTYPMSHRPHFLAGPQVLFAMFPFLHCGNEKSNTVALALRFPSHRAMMTIAGSVAAGRHHHPVLPVALTCLLAKRQLRLYRGPVVLEAETLLLW